MLWLWMVAVGAVVIAILAWWLIFRAAMKDRNDHGEFTYRDVYSP